MAAIDLTPDNMKESQHRRRHIRVWYAILIVTFICMGAWALINLLGYQREVHTVQQISQENKTIKDGIESLSQVRSRINLWQDRLVLMQELDSYGDLVKITDYLTQHTPQLIYLDHLSFYRPENNHYSTPKTSPTKSAAAEMFDTNESAKLETDNPTQINYEPIIMTLSGHSVNYKSITDFLNMLKSAKLITEPKLKFSRRQLNASSDFKDVIDFEIEAQLVLIPSFPGIQYANMQKTKDI